MQQNTGQIVYYDNGGAVMQPLGQNVVVGPQNLQPLGQNVVAGQQAFQPMGQNFVPPQQYIIMSAPMAPTIPTAYPTYKRCSSRILGILQISMGLLLIGMNIGLAVIKYNTYWAISSGWWASVFFIVGGSFGIVAGSKPNKCTIITTMVLSIFSCVTIIAVVVQGALGLASGCSSFRHCYYQVGNTAMHALSIVFGVCELAVGLAQSILCGQALYQASKAQVNTFSGFQNGYVNGGFSFMGPQGPVQNIPMQTYGQSVQFAPYSGTMATRQIADNVQTVNEGQHNTIPTLQTGGATVQQGDAVPTRTPQNDTDTRETTKDLPPPYSD